jgi:CPA2 family monovalent cation:H+ antiporter-2
MYELGAETELSPDDIMLLISPPEQLEEIREFFENGE